MKRITSAALLAAMVAGLAIAGCGTESTPSAGAGTAAALRAASREMERRDGDDRDDGRDDERVSYFMTVLNELRQVPALAPLFDRYEVPNPIRYDDDAYGLVSLLRAVRITLANGDVTLANRETGGVIYAAPLADLDAGTFHPENVPGATTPPPTTCSAFTYSAWGACQPNNTQARTVTSSSPAGCTGGAPVTSQACTYVPPAPATCSAFTYSAWGACQPNNTQTRAVTSSSPAGCTGGAPVTTQACTYVPPAPATCSAFTYSAWGACQPNNTQTRTVTSSSPAGCTGGAPVTTQACTYVPPACTYTYSAWSACSTSGTQTRTVASSSPAGCAGTPVLSQSCTPPAPACGTCHAIPPSSGRHARHTSFATCATCHGTGYSTTTVNAATHQNGVVNTASGAGYSASTNSCANSCHGSRSW